MPGYELRCVDENGQKIAKGTGEVGELVVRGASAADGYWNSAIKVAQHLRANGRGRGINMKSPKMAVTSTAGVQMTCSRFPVFGSAHLKWNKP